jgi:hypothetical protein
VAPGWSELVAELVCVEAGVAKDAVQSPAFEFLVKRDETQLSLHALKSESSTASARSAELAKRTRDR